jgi:DNA-binding response OmpR family regulator
MQALIYSPYTQEASMLLSTLQQAGFSVRSTPSIQHTLNEIPEKSAEIIVVAIQPGDEKMIKVIEQIRTQTAMTIIIICEMITEDYHIRLLETGADLVITRPFSSRLLIAQIKSTLRRTAGMPFFTLPTLSQAQITLDPTSRTVQVAEEEPKRLTQLEFRLLYTLMTHPGQIIPTNSIVEHVWGYSGEGSRELVRGLVKRLRSKIEKDSHNPQYIKTESGIGYFLDIHTKN